MPSSRSATIIHWKWSLSPVPYRPFSTIPHESIEVLYNVRSSESAPVHFRAARSGPWARARRVRHVLVPFLCFIFSYFCSRFGLRIRNRSTRSGSATWRLFGPFRVWSDAFGSCRNRCRFDSFHFPTQFDGLFLDISGFLYSVYATRSFLKCDISWERPRTLSSHVVYWWWRPPSGNWAVASTMADGNKSDFDCRQVRLTTCLYVGRHHYHTTKTTIVCWWWAAVKRAASSTMASIIRGDNYSFDIYNLPFEGISFFIVSFCIPCL